MAGKIFINYRRGESLRDAQHLATLLGKRFGDKRIFIDVRGIDGGDQWLHTLEKQVAASDAMVALIGKGWIDVKDDEGNRRLDNPNDFVRFEIAQALQRDIPVLPVLLDGAQVPKIAQLPQDMMALSLFQAMPLRIESVVPDAEAIARRLKIVLDRRKRRGVPAWVAGVGAAFLVTASVAAGPFVLGQLGLMPVAPSLSDVQKQLDIAKGDVAKAREDAERLRPAVQERDQTRSALANANQKAVDLQNVIDATNGETAKAREEIERLKLIVQERDQARSDLANANKKVVDLQKTIDAANGEMAKAREEVQRLRSAVQERDLARSELANANKRVVDLQKTVDAANGEMAKAREEIQRLKSAMQERDQARSDLAGANTRLGDLQKQLDAAKREIGGLRKGADEQGSRDPALAVTPGSGQSFRDRLADGQPCPLCPELVAVPAGQFTKGSPNDEIGREEVIPDMPWTQGQIHLRGLFRLLGSESPLQIVNVAKPFAVGRFAVTFREWDACVADGGCNDYLPQDQDWGRDARPVINVSWNDAMAYVSWLERKTGKQFRLLSDSEREYVTRARNTKGVSDPYWWGKKILSTHANVANPSTDNKKRKEEAPRGTVNVNSFAPNPWGLYNVHGNVWEWTSDCWESRSLPTDEANCQRTIRGGSWYNSASYARAASRSYLGRELRFRNLGFRVARSIQQ